MDSLIKLKHDDHKLKSCHPLNALKKGEKILSSVHYVWLWGREGGREGVVKTASEILKLTHDDSQVCVHMSRNV